MTSCIQLVEDANTPSHVFKFQSCESFFVAEVLEFDAAQVEYQKNVIDKGLKGPLGMRHFQCCQF